MPAYTVIVYEDDEGGFYTSVPAFDIGVEADTIEDALTATRDAMTEAINAMIEEGEVIPLPDSGNIAAVAQIEAEVTVADAG